MDSAEGLYIISVAARLLSMHQQTLRKYERLGFLTPIRVGVLRLYSQQDIARLRLIKHLVEETELNLAGVELALDFAQRLQRLYDVASSAQDEDGELRKAILEETSAMLDALGIQTA